MVLRPDFSEELDPSTDPVGNQQNESLEGVGHLLQMADSVLKGWVGVPHSVALPACPHAVGFLKRSENRAMRCTVLRSQGAQTPS